MQNSKRLPLFFSLVLVAVFLSGSCGKDKDDNPKPDSELRRGVAAATIEFMDIKKTVRFTGSGFGAVLTGSQDTVWMSFRGKDSPMAFWIVMTPVKKGKLFTQQDTFECYALFWEDSTITDYSKLYSLGENLEGENRSFVQGEAAFDITTFSNDYIQGAFTLTMVQFEGDNGEMKTKKLKITNGKFDVPLFEGSDFGVPEQ